MSEYLRFENQLWLANATEESAVFDIIGALYGKFDDLNLEVSYEAVLSENYLNYIINTEALIDDLVVLMSLSKPSEPNKHNENEKKKRLYLPNSLMNKVSHSDLKNLTP